MASLELKCRVRIAWWVRPALVGAFLCAMACPARVEKWIDAIVDRGIKVELV